MFKLRYLPRVGREYCKKVTWFEMTSSLKLYLSGCLKTLVISIGKFWCLDLMPSIKISYWNWCIFYQWKILILVNESAKLIILKFLEVNVKQFQVQLKSQEWIREHCKKFWSQDKSSRDQGRVWEFLLGKKKKLSQKGTLNYIIFAHILMSFYAYRYLFMNCRFSK